MADPGAAEAQLLAQLDQLERGLMPQARGGLVEQPDSQESQPAQRKPHRDFPAGITRVVTDRRCTERRLVRPLTPCNCRSRLCPRPTPNLDGGSTRVKMRPYQSEQWAALMIRRPGPNTMLRMDNNAPSCAPDPAQPTGRSRDVTRRRRQQRPPMEQQTVHGSCSWLSKWCARERWWCPGSRTRWASSTIWSSSCRACS